MEAAIGVTNAGGSFKSFTVLFAKIVTSESGSKNKIIGRKQKSLNWNYCNLLLMWLEIRITTIPKGFQVKASLYLWPSTSMSNLIGTKFSAVGLPLSIYQHQFFSHVQTGITIWLQQISNEKIYRNWQLTFWIWQQCSSRKPTVAPSSPHLLPFTFRMQPFFSQNPPL